MPYTRLVHTLILLTQLITQISAQEEYRFTSLESETLFRELYSDDEGNNIAIITNINSEIDLNYIVKLDNGLVQVLSTIEGQYKYAFEVDNILRIVTSDNGTLFLNEVNEGYESYNSIPLELAPSFHIYDILVMDDGYMVSGNTAGQINFVKLNFEGLVMDLYQDDQFTFQYPEFLTYIEQREDGSVLSAIYCDRLAVLDPNDLSSVEWQIQPQICGPIDRMISTQGSTLGEYAVLGSLDFDDDTYADLIFSSRSFNDEPTNWFFLSSGNEHYIHGDAKASEDLIYFSSVLKNTFDIGGLSDFNLSITNHSGSPVESFTWVTPEFQESLAELYVGEEDVWIYSSQLGTDGLGQQAYALKVPKEILNFTSVELIDEKHHVQLQVDPFNWTIKSNDHQLLQCEIYTIDGRLILTQSGIAQVMIKRNTIPSGILILKAISENSVRSWKLFSH